MERSLFGFIFKSCFYYSIFWFLSDKLWKLKTHFKCFQVIKIELWWHFGNFLRNTWAHGRELSNPSQNFCSLQHSTQWLLLMCLSPSHESHWRANPSVHFFRATSFIPNPSQPYFFFSNLTPIHGLTSPICPSPFPQRPIRRRRSQTTLNLEHCELWQWWDQRV